MPDASSIVGVLSVFVSAAANGSMYIPVKRHEVHDGLVYQWYQCSGIMLGGILCAITRNCWSDPAGHFFVAWHGLLSGVMWTAANVAATTAVKLCGLSIYFILHEITNIGGAFVFGVFGKYVGLETTPPKNIPLAALGVTLVFIGTLPVAWLKSPEVVEQEEIASQQAQAALQYEPPRVAAVPAPIETSDSDSLGGGGVFGLHLPSTPPRKPSLGGLPFMLEGLIPTEGSTPYLERNALTWDGATPLLVRQRTPARSPKALEGLPTMPMVFAVEDLDEPPMSVIQEDSNGVTTGLADDPVAGGQVVPAYGLFCCIMCGLLWSGMYLPAGPWRQEMQAHGREASGADYLFSECVGIYLSSTLWMLGVGAWQRMQGLRMEKPVLRPAMCAGLVWTLGAYGTLLAMQHLPYAVAYCCASGGALMISLVWGSVVFGEAAGMHNKRCIFTSFLCISIGVLCLGMSMH